MEESNRHNGFLICGVPTLDSDNPFALDSSLVRIKELLEKAGFDLPEDEKRLGIILQLVQALEKEDVQPEDLLDCAREAGKILDLRALAEELGSTEVRIKELNAFGHLMEEQGLSLNDAKGFLQFHGELKKMGFTRKLAEAIARASNAARKRSDSDAKATERLIGLASEGVAVQEDNAKLEKRQEVLDDSISQLEKKEDQFCEDIERLKASRQKIAGELNALQKNADTIRAETAKARQELDRVKRLVTGFSALSARHRTASFFQWGVGCLLAEPGPQQAFGFWTAIEKLCQFRMSGDNDPEKSRLLVEEATSIAARFYKPEKQPTDALRERLTKLMEFQEIKDGLRRAKGEYAARLQQLEHVTNQHELARIFLASFDADPAGSAPTDRVFTEFEELCKIRSGRGWYPDRTEAFTAQVKKVFEVGKPLLDTRQQQPPPPIDGSSKPGEDPSGADQKATV